MARTLEEINTCEHCGKQILDPEHLQKMAAIRLEQPRYAKAVMVPFALPPQAGVIGICFGHATFIDGELVNITAPCDKNPEWKGSLFDG